MVGGQLAVGCVLHQLISDGDQRPAVGHQRGFVGGIVHISPVCARSRDGGAARKASIVGGDGHHGISHRRGRQGTGQRTGNDDRFIALTHRVLHHRKAKGGVPGGLPGGDGDSGRSGGREVVGSPLRGGSARHRNRNHRPPRRSGHTSGQSGGDGNGLRGGGSRFGHRRRVDGQNRSVVGGDGHHGIGDRRGGQGTGQRTGNDDRFIALSRRIRHHRQVKGGVPGGLPGGDSDGNRDGGREILGNPLHGGPPRHRQRDLRSPRRSGHPRRQSGGNGDGLRVVGTGFVHHCRGNAQNRSVVAGDGNRGIGDRRGGQGTGQRTGDDNRFIALAHRIRLHRKTKSGAAGGLPGGDENGGRSGSGEIVGSPHHGGSPRHRNRNYRPPRRSGHPGGQGGGNGNALRVVGTVFNHHRRVDAQNRLRDAPVVAGDGNRGAGNRRRGQGTGQRTGDGDRFMDFSHRVRFHRHAKSGAPGGLPVGDGDGGRGGGGEIVGSPHHGGSPGHRNRNRSSPHRGGLAGGQGGGDGDGLRIVGAVFGYHRRGDGEDGRRVGDGQLDWVDGQPSGAAGNGQSLGPFRVVRIRWNDHLEHDGTAHGTSRDGQSQVVGREEILPGGGPVPGNRPHRGVDYRILVAGGRVAREGGSQSNQDGPGPIGRLGHRGGRQGQVNGGGRLVAFRNGELNRLHRVPGSFPG